jgi:hypothetical protein
MMKYKENIDFNKQLWEQSNIIYKQKESHGFVSIIKSQRFDTTIFKGIGSKKELKKYLNKYPDNKAIAQILDKNGYRQFISFKSWEICWDKYQHEAKIKRYLYEVILSNKPCKPYLDIEWKISNTHMKVINNSTKGFITKLTEDIILIFNKRYNINLEQIDILFLKAHSYTKISFHVIINKLKNNNTQVYETNKKYEKNSSHDLYLALIELDEQYYKEKLDESVYSLDREMRTIYSTKYNENRQFIPVNAKCNDKFIDNYLDYFITEITDNYTIIKTPMRLPENLKQIRKTKKLPEINNYMKKYSNDEYIFKLIEIIQQIHPTVYYTNKTDDGYGYRFSYTDRNELCYTGIKHDNNGFCAYINGKTGDIYLFCHSKKCKRLYKIGNIDYNNKWKDTAIIINQQYLNYTIKMELYKDINMEFIGHINKFIDNGKIIAIKSRMGTGKTFMLKEIIKNHFMDKRILYLSHRQTFTNNIYGTLKDLGFYNYLDGVDGLYNHDKLIVQLDSLIHIINFDELIPYDLIIMDEIESILAHLSSPYLKNNLPLICDIIYISLKKTKYIIALDADFNDRSYDFLNGINNEQYFPVIINEYKQIKKKFCFNIDYNTRIYQIKEDIKQNKNIVIICLSKDKMDFIYEELIKQNEQLKILRYSSMTDDDQKTQLIDVNNYWNRYQVILYTSVIESGVDFNINYFHRMYCFISPNTCSPRAFLQMVGRIRQIEDNNIRVYYDNNMNYYDGNIYIPSIIEYEEYIINNNKQIISIIEDLKSKNKIYVKILSYNMQEEAVKRSYFLLKLRELIVENEDYYINENTDQNEEDDTPEKSEICECDNKTNSTFIDDPKIILPTKSHTTHSSKTNKDNIVEINNILEVEIPTKEEYNECEKRKQHNVANREQKLKIKKYRYMINFKLKPEELTKEFLIDWYGKEYIRENFVRLNKIINGKIDVVDKQDKYILDMMKIFGFKDLKDINREITKDGNMKKRMIDYKMMDNYGNIMKAFKKSERSDKKESYEKFFTRIAKMIFDEYGIYLNAKRIRKMINKQMINTKKYSIKYNKIYLNKQI